MALVGENVVNVFRLIDLLVSPELVEKFVSLVARLVIYPASARFYAHLGFQELVVKELSKNGFGCLVSYIAGQQP